MKAIKTAKQLSGQYSWGGRKSPDQDFGSSQVANKIMIKKGVNGSIREDIDNWTEQEWALFNLTCSHIEESFFQLKLLGGTS